MFAVISDIHSNMEALTAVLEHIKQQGVEKIYCLGDVIGYGPDPCAALDLTRENCDVVIMGNHDYAVLYEPTRFNIGAENAVFWTRHQLESEEDKDLVSERWSFLGKNDIRHLFDGSDYKVKEILMVHGSPRKPVNEYLFAEDIHNNASKLRASMDRFTGLCFVGHTHLPGVFTPNNQFLTPNDLNGVFEYDETLKKAIVNVGSVGQPRDRNCRSCYVTVEPGKITYHRVDYDLKSTVDKLLNIEGLDDGLATRLNNGR